jgi:SAM-dependent methyltransferase
MNGDPHSRERESRAAWNAYWQGSGKVAQSVQTGCLPDAWPGIAQVQGKAWKQFVRRLPKGAPLLDLGTGDGRAIAWMLEARRDLKPVGIDQATELPSPPRGARFRTNVQMHALPFPDASFAAVASQFGFEYGEIGGTAGEAARVLRPGGTVGIICHRIDSPIVAHNRARRAQICWAIDERDLPGIAERSLQLRKIGVRTVPPELLAAPAEGAAAFGEGSAAWEIAEAILRTLVAGHNDPPDHTAQVIGEIVAQARNEIGRIASLEMAAENSGHGEKLAAALVTAGLELREQQPLYDRAVDAPFATFLTFVKPV